MQQALWRTSKVILVWGTFILAANFEVRGDARIRQGMSDGNWGYIKAEGWKSIGCGVFLLCLYGLVVNAGFALKLIDWGFSKQLGVYVFLFAIVSTYIGHTSFNETVSVTHLIGLAFIIAGGLIIQAS
jgi:drug/metabolite transporter (DMT)-like permease